MKPVSFIRSILTVHLVVLTVLASAQVAVNGRVVDASSRLVLNNVNVAVQNTTFQTQTDNSGYFRFTPEVGYPFTLILKYEGYIPLEYVVDRDRGFLELELEKIVVKKENVKILGESEMDAQETDVGTDKIRISGTVAENSTGEPLSGVNITVKNTTTGVASDNNGYFSLSANIELPAVVRFSMIGLQTTEVRITRNYRDMKIYLDQESILSEEVVVKADEIEVEQKNFVQIRTMETIDALTIRETAASNFYQAVSNLKGVDVVMQSMNFMTVNARGFNSTENTRFVQIVDGMDNMAPGMNFPIGNIAGLNELDVEQLEFIPGPSEVQYGGNALNGILKMSGKDPFKFQGVSLLVKPGVSDVVSGSDHPLQFDGKPQIETAIRAAKAFNDKIAFKINASYSQGRDWYADDTTNIRPGNVKWEPDPGHDAINKYGDEVTADLPVGERGANIIVSRTGYRDKDLINNDARNLKLNGAVHYKFSENTVAILQANYGLATTAYTGDNRISLSDFKIYQGKAELQGSHFLLRGYASMQNSGNSYDAKFLAVNLNKQARSDEDWFRDYYNAYVGNYRKVGVLSYDHNEARKFADRYRLLPGTPEFEAAKQEMINDPDFTKGAGIYNNSVMYAFDAVFDLNKYTKETKINIGGNFRFFDLDSKGSIFPDTLGNDITCYEYGFFVEAQRHFFDENLMLKASVRYDKSENFEGHFSPRFSALYTINDKNNVRISVLTGFRNPGVKEQFINQDLGTARYLGGLKALNRAYDIPLNSIFLDKVNEYNAAVDFDVKNPDDPYNLQQAMLKNLDILEAGIVEPEQVDELVPEQVITFEVGYKTNLANSLFLDAVYYNSIYNDFIGIAKVVKPKTSPQVDMLTAAAQINESAQNDVYYLNVNAQEKIGIQGVALGYKWLMPMGSILSGNLTWSDIRTQVDDPIAPGFNTPGFKSNLSIQNRKMDKMENNPGFRNIGFKVTWRYQSRYYWESAFGDGWVEPVSTFDIQFSVNIDRPKSVLKFGAANFFNNKFTYSFGGSNIGVLYYVSYVIDNLWEGN